MPEKGRRFQTFGGEVFVIKDVTWFEDLHSGPSSNEAIRVILHIVLAKPEEPVEPWVMQQSDLGADAPRFR
ncbi:MAG: hypothetical protein M3422_05410 [Actinomycetota bacterium]|nr:hypothetical protein [Actinomycetota bacterium]